jgi:hypothetical protein
MLHGTFVITIYTLLKKKLQKASDFVEFCFEQLQNASDRLNKFIGMSESI